MHHYALTLYKAKGRLSYVKSEHTMLEPLSAVNVSLVLHI